MFSKKLCCTLSACLLLAAISQGRTIYVPDDHTTIQGAIDAAAAGDTIIVRPGTYVENIDDSYDRPVILKSELGPAYTVIDGNGNGSVVTFDSEKAQGSVFEGFCIRNGTGTYDRKYGGLCGGGIYSAWWSTPTIRNNVVMANKADCGGGIFCGYYSSSKIINNIVTANTADYGGGIGCVDPEPSTRIVNNTVTLNTASVSGGGIYVIFLQLPNIKISTRSCGTTTLRRTRTSSSHSSTRSW